MASQEKYITGEDPAIDDRVVYSSRGKYGSTYHNHGWTDKTGNVTIPIPCPQHGTVKDVGRFDLTVEFDAWPGTHFDIDARLFERIATIAQNNIAAHIANNVASAPTARTCSCSISTLMRDGCTCGSITRHVPAKLA